MTDWLDQLKWNSNGLLPAIAQDHQTGKVLMLAWMNREALQLSHEQGRAVYWSRSRQKLWVKGEESGHLQELREIRIDCDADVVLLQVEQIGGISCHTGRHRCFFRLLKDGEWEIDEEIIKNPDEIYR
jgi:phosphoribosyl-AMP cyclohydrolase